MAGQTQSRWAAVEYTSGPASAHPVACYCMDCIGRPLGEVHFFYPSMTIACGVDAEALWAPELSCTRSTVTCQLCIERVAADQSICAHCRGDRRLLHTCDPVKLGPPPFN